MMLLLVTLLSLLLLLATSSQHTASSSVSSTQPISTTLASSATFRDEDADSAAALACNAAGGARRYLLPGESPARCIDGTNPAFFLRRGKGDGANKWLVYFEGGGWCFSLDLCEIRAKTVLGSSKYYPTCLARNDLKDFLSDSPKTNPLFHNWNIVQVKYCDGSSYAGEIDIPYHGKTMYFRGKINREETIKALLSLGMNVASEIAICGCSAGGLAIYLGVDQMAQQIKESNPMAIVRAISFSGFFLDYSSKIPTNPTKDDGVWNGNLDYANAMRNNFNWMNISSGANPSCLSHSQRKSHDPSQCIFARYLAPHITTPIFSIQVPGLAQIS